MKLQNSNPGMTKRKLLYRNTLSLQGSKNESLSGKKTLGYKALYLGGAFNYDFGLGRFQAGEGGAGGRRNWRQMPEITYWDKRH